MLDKARILNLWERVLIADWKTFSTHTSALFSYVGASVHPDNAAYIRLQEERRTRWSDWAPEPDYGPHSWTFPSEPNDRISLAWDLFASVAEQAETDLVLLWQMYMGSTGDNITRFRDDWGHFFVDAIESIVAAEAPATPERASVSAAEEALLSHELMLELHEAVTAVGLLDNRRALFAGLDRALIATFPTMPEPAAQLLSDLDELNKLRPRSGAPPLMIWLANAVRLRPMHTQAEVFQQCLSRLRKDAIAAGIPPVIDDDSELLQLRADFNRFVRRLETEWTSERDSHPMGATEGKRILDAARDDVLDFRADINQGMEDVVLELNAVATELQSCQRHIVRMDGGASLARFWTRGNEIIEKLRTIQSLLDKHVEAHGG